ncbi:hypothetical protein [Streptomyces sp. TLI_55]|uniref:hypothetical protein n=1 Tax=Streptomyces sp. TLI_55 TaxID=1938861 RepID=UPI00117CA56D|nr:hypothetical protein [Streptomyces sp. TLI_55]
MELNVRGARKPEWVAANTNNPLRDWDGREHTPCTGYRKAVVNMDTVGPVFGARTKIATG